MLFSGVSSWVQPITLDKTRVREAPRTKNAAYRKRGDFCDTGMLATTQLLQKQPLCVALEGVSFGAEATTALDPLIRAERKVVVARDMSEAPLSLGDANCYTQALISEIRTAASVSAPYLYIPNKPLAAVLRNSLGLFHLAFSIVEDHKELQRLPGRSWIIDLSGPNVRGSLERRHFGGSPIWTPESDSVGRLFLPLVAKIKETEKLQNLIGPQSPSSHGTAQGVGQGVSLFTIGGLNNTGGYLVDSKTFESLATAYNSEVFSSGAQPSEPRVGFMARYDAAAFARMLQRPGCSLALLERGGLVLGYGVGYFQARQLPLHGQRLMAVLECLDALPQGDLGFVDLFHITKAGQALARLLRFEPYKQVHEQMIATARQAGLTHLIAQTREFPHPNHEALAVHKKHGWVDTKKFVLYPTAEGPEGWQYRMGRVIMYDLQK